MISMALNEVIAVLLNWSLSDPKRVCVTSQQCNDHASGLALQVLFFSHKSMKHRVTVSALCLKTVAREQTTFAASQGINQLLAPFNYYLLFYGFDKVFNGIKALSLSAIVFQFGFSEIA